MNDTIPQCTVPQKAIASAVSNIRRIVDNYISGTMLLDSLYTADGRGCAVSSTARTAESPHVKYTEDGRKSAC